MKEDTRPITQEEIDRLAEEAMAAIKHTDELAERSYQKAREAFLNPPDHVLLRQYEDAIAGRDIAIARAGHIEQALLRRMNERGATAIPDETFICEMEVKNTYDQNQLTLLLEIFNEVEIEKCYEPAYQKTVDVPAKWRIQQVIAAAKRRGKEALDVVERARIPGAPRIRFERRE